MQVDLLFAFISLGLPQEFGNRDFKPPAEVPCVVEWLCKKHQGVIFSHYVSQTTTYKPNQNQILYLDT